MTGIDDCVKDTAEWILRVCAESFDKLVYDLDMQSALNHVQGVEMLRIGAMSDSVDGQSGVTLAACIRLPVIGVAQAKARPYGLIVANSMHEDLEGMDILTGAWIAVNAIDCEGSVHWRGALHSRAGAVGEADIEKIEDSCLVRWVRRREKDSVLSCGRDLKRHGETVQMKQCP